MASDPPDRDRAQRRIFLRRFDALMLLIASIELAVVSFDEFVLPVSLCLVACSMLLTWGNFREQRRLRQAAELARLDRLIVLGLRVDVRFRLASQQRGAWPRARDRALARWEMEKWLDRARRDLRAYPELAPIFEAAGADDQAQELAERIWRLGQVKHLLAASFRTGLARRADAAPLGDLRTALQQRRPWA